jgi:hypothetical protein
LQDIEPQVARDVVNDYVVKVCTETVVKICGLAGPHTAQQTPMPSWQEAPAKK